MAQKILGLLRLWEPLKRNSLDEMKNPRSSSYEQFCFISPLAFCHIFKVQFSLDHIIKFLKYLILEQNSLFFSPSARHNDLNSTYPVSCSQLSKLLPDKSAKPIFQLNPETSFLFSHIIVAVWWSNLSVELLIQRQELCCPLAERLNAARVEGGTPFLGQPGWKHLYLLLCKPLD